MKFLGLYKKNIPVTISKSCHALGKEKFFSNQVLSRINNKVK